ncbi:Endo-1,4-beta-xylanase A precursor [Enhygromyxa salina]|uniref:Endo-1,4-beta-xylanase A n=1 Tax=Enhygromyxa salina TaxID=215803 RepID=A0A0C1ZLH9_9BACT|nr:Endo-1,4-beta-xylanase A precursor [Enhygromyxa salina]
MALVLAGCLLDNPAFDESRLSAGDGNDDGQATSETRGGDLDAGDGDGDSGDGDSSTDNGDGDSGPGDGDGDGTTETDTGSSETGNDMPCMGLGPAKCETTDGCLGVYYEPMEPLLNDPSDGYCVEDPVYDGCIPEPACDPPASPYWCKMDFYIRVELNGCLPSVVDQMGLDTCSPPGNSVSECAGNP